MCVAHTRKLVHGNYCFYNNGPCPLEVSSERQFQGQISLSQLQLFSLVTLEFVESSSIT